MSRERETINISNASTLTNLFYLFFHGGKAAIIPFLTLFFRLVGLNAFEAGIIIAAKTLTALIWAPLWSRCATAYNHHRLVLILSLFMMMVTYLSFPALYTQISKAEHCMAPGNINSNSSTDSQKLTGGPQTPPANYSISKSSFSISTPVSTINVTEKVETSSMIIPLEVSHYTAEPTNVTSFEPSENETDHLSRRDLYSFSSHPTTDKDQNVIQALSTFNTSDTEALDQQLQSILKALNFDLDEFLKANLSLNELTTLMNIGRNYSDQITEKQAEKLYRQLHELGEANVAIQVKERSVNNERYKRSDLVDTLKEKLHTIQATLQDDRLLLFLVILAIIVVGEIFASPVEKVADDSWFDFLSRIDDLERYGQQRIWGSIAFVLIPVVVTVAVDHSPCFLPFQIHHYFLHFYIFAVLMAAAIVVSCCYPVPPPANGKHTSKICKGIRLICCDGHGFLFSVTLLLTGMVYASYHNFLFWRIQDLGGLETTMGLCVSIGAFAEIPMLILSGNLVKKLGPSWMVSVSLIILSLRVLFYAFNQEPWAFLPIELSHGITHTTLWFAILSYDDFNIGASVDRSLRTILSSFYFGIGFSAGSLISGLVYHFYGSSVLFWVGSAVIGGWCVIFSIVQKCMPKKEKVRYIKLLRSESDNSDEENEDWLEMALKDH
ncbi:unnamed protein product [Lymnaea stagnalis]|uniref:Major facilitator superfamily associated domain-containing protein n=1 Tax=Lymnaea stagnalis TaxID=6523 RepID=A0AAV2GYU0_LYMST